MRYGERREKGCGAVEGGREGCRTVQEGSAGDGARRFGFVKGAAVPWWPGPKVVKRPFRDGERGDAG